MSHLLKLTDVHASIGAKSILNGLNLEINPGETHVIIFKVEITLVRLLESFHTRWKLNDMYLDAPDTHAKFPMLVRVNFS